MDLELLPPTASQEEIDEELAFINVLIESLSPGADDYESTRRQYEHARAHCKRLLQPFHANASQQQQMQPDDQAQPMGEGSAAQMQPDNWWQMAASGRPVSNHSSHSGMSSSPFAPISNNHFATPGNGTKRARPESLHGSSADYAMKRPTPAQSSVGTPASSTESFDMADSIERARTKQLAAEAAARRQSELQQADARLAAALAAEMSAPQSSSSASSSRPIHQNFQTTFDYNGGYQRPSPVQPKASSSSQLPAHQRIPAQTFRPPVPHQNIKSESLKPEPGLPRHPTFGQMPRQSTAVVDLTASDSEDDEIAEIAPDRFRPNNIRQQSVPMRPLQMPGAYPAPNIANGPPVYGNGNVYNNPGLLRQTVNGAVNGLNYAVGRLGGQMTQLHDLLYERSSARPFDLDDDDDDVIYGGARALPVVPGYAGNENLYQQRFDALAAYDPTQSKEEIQALMENIRPDEDMPAHLRVSTPEDMSVQLHKYQEMGLTWLQKQESGSNMGGILADDMGLGKTIQMLSLMVTRKSEEQRCKTTLIIAPLALMRQWKQEIKDKLKPGRAALRVFTHHGSTKAKDWNELRQYDVVLTTFGSIGIEVKKMEKFRLRQAQDSNARPHSSEKCVFLDPDARWYRVILDEAQVRLLRVSPSRKC